ncbi:MAG: ABC transporter permease [Betaproteobacteria bacterium SG8_39]|nr:MAG: ABC transporter permease [Betaproteobacteria bacterium SG8_39]
MLRAVLLTALAPIVWGSVYLVTTEFLPPGRPLLAGALRALPVGLLIVAAYGRLPAGAWWGRAFVLGQLHIGVFFALLFFAAYRLPGGIAATIIAMQPLFVALLGWALHGHRPSLVTVGAALSGIAGVGLIVLRPEAALDAWGVAAAFGAALCMAAGTVYASRWPSPVPLLLSTGWQLVAGGLLLIVLALSLEGLPSTLSAANVGGFVYLGVVATGLAYLLWFRGIRQLGVSVSFLVLLSPTAALLLGYFLRDERLGVVQLLGVAIVVASVAAGQWDGSRRSRQALLG